MFFFKKAGGAKRNKGSRGGAELDANIRNRHRLTLVADIRNEHWMQAIGLELELGPGVILSLVLRGKPKSSRVVFKGVRLFLLVP